MVACITPSAGNNDCHVVTVGLISFLFIKVQTCSLSKKKKKSIRIASIRGLIGHVQWCGAECCTQRLGYMLGSCIKYGYIIYDNYCHYMYIGISPHTVLCLK